MQGSGSFWSFLYLLWVSGVVWVPLGLVGFFIGRYVVNAGAHWFWVIGLIGVSWLGYGIWDDCRAYRFPAWFPPKADFIHRAWHIFFTYSDAEAWGGSSLVLILFTIPAFACIAFSLGVMLGFKSGNAPPQ
jgi:hypothetical protein